jgi:hypothetical protein
MYRSFLTPQSSRYPDGAFWQEEVQNHGADAVASATRQYASRLLLSEPTFSENHTAAAQTRLRYSTKSPAVFYNVIVPHELSQAGVQEELQFVQDQLRIVGTASGLSKPTTVYVSTIGHQVLKTLDICNSQDGLECHHLAHHDENPRGETQSHIHEFCEQNPTQRVVFLQNQHPSSGKGREKPNVLPPPDQLRTLIKHITRAATSDLCLSSIQKDSCNVCGLAFYTMPSMSMHGVRVLLTVSHAFHISHYRNL